MGSQFKQRLKVHKIGNSYAIVVPIVWCRWNGVEAGDRVDVQIEETKLIISVDKQNGN